MVIAVDIWVEITGVEALVEFEANALLDAIKAGGAEEGDKYKDFYTLTNTWVKMVVDLSKFSNGSVVLLDGPFDSSCFLFEFCWPGLRAINKPKLAFNTSFISRIINQLIHK